MKGLGIRSFFAMDEFAIFLAQVLDPIRFVLAAIASGLVLALFQGKKSHIAAALVPASIVTSLFFQFVFLSYTSDSAIFIGFFSTYIQCLIASVAISWWRG